MKHTKKNTRKNTVKASEIVSHGRAFPSGLFIFSCYSRGLGQFRTDAESREEANADALAHFNQEARK